MKRFRGPASDEETVRFSIELPRPLLIVVEDYAKKKKRSRAGFCVDLIEWAIAQIQAASDPGEGNIKRPHPASPGQGAP